MDYLKLFKTNRKAFLIGLVAIFFLFILIVFQKFKPSSTNQQPSFKMDEHIAQTVQFRSKIIGNQDKTQVFIPFSFKTEAMPLVLGYQIKDGTMKEFLIFHPQLSFLDWGAIRDKEVTLYQKVKKYDSISEFIKNPTGKIAAEVRLKEQYPQLRADSIYFSNDNPIDLEKYDYIFSTQTSLSRTGTTYYYKNILNTSDALLDEDDQITWIIRAPDANENNRFYLGNIEVVYLVQ